MDSRAAMVVIVVVAVHTVRTINWQLVIITRPSVPMSRSRPVPVLPRASGGPEPAAGRFKAAYRAAGRPDRT
jgi:hypothetical protein